MDLTKSQSIKGQKSNFPEHGHVAYQINGNHEMQQHGSKIFAQLLLPPPPTQVPSGRGQKVKILLFQNMVQLHIKIKGITSGDRVNSSKVNFSELVMLHIKLKERRNAGTR